MPSATTTVVWLVLSSWPQQRTEFIAAFTTSRQAKVLLRRRQKEDPYEAQYDYIKTVRAYTTLARWESVQKEEK